MRLIRFGVTSLLALVLGAAIALADPNPAPADLSAWVVGADVRLSWVAPDPASGNVQVRLMRRLNTPPVSPQDPAAQLLYAGPANQYVDPIPGLVPNFTTASVYHYAVFGCDAGGTVCEAAGSRTTAALSLIECLRSGGYTIYWRHSDADVCADQTILGTAATTTVPNWWRTCDSNCGTTTARQLNAAGVQHAIAIGQRFASANIPVGRVLSSEYCRCIQTAEDMAFGPAIETNQGITFFVYDEANRCAASYGLINTSPTAGTNTAILGHAGFTGTCTTLGNLAWAECAVFKPDGLGGATLIGRLTWDQWASLLIDVPEPAIALATTMLDAPYESAGGVRLRYRLANAAAEPVRLEIFDVRGRRVWSVVERQSRGEYEHTWDRRDTSGERVHRGVYFVRLITPAGATSRKAMILSR